MTCKNCIYEPMCHNVIAYGMDTDDVTATLITDIEKHCKHFKDKSRVIVPPCKVGDTVYCINTFFQSDPRITECEVDALHITSGKNIRGHRTPPYVLVRNKNMRSLSSRIYFEKFGITAFLTLEEAEKALAERSVAE